MSRLTVEQTMAMLQAVAKRLTSERDHLCELDGHIGDADHGIAMAQGFEAVSTALADLDEPTVTLGDVFNTAAKSFLNAVGASSGPLYATAFMRVGKQFKDVSDLALDQTPEIFTLMATGIEARGKAVPGEKTMVDAWAPAAVAAQEQTDGPTTLVAIRDAARSGAEATVDMIASKGRAARLGERSRGHMDPGAASAAIIIEVMTEHLMGLGK